MNKTSLFVNENLASTLRYCYQIVFKFFLYFYYFRYLLSMNNHGVVTSTLDFLVKLLHKLKGALFTRLYMKMMVDKIKPISNKEVNFTIIAVILLLISGIFQLLYRANQNLQLRLSLSNNIRRFHK